MIMFLVRFKSLDGSPTTIYCEIPAAFSVAYALDKSSDCIEFRCFDRDCQVDTIPGSHYKPISLVEKFDFTKD